MAVGGALFSGGGRAAPAGSKALVEFRAGKMNLNGTTVTPDKRKGLVMVEQVRQSIILLRVWVGHKFTFHVKVQNT
jgi:26S proteasome regulatory subunit N13